MSSEAKFHQHPPWPQAESLFPLEILTEAAAGLVQACDSVLGASVEHTETAERPNAGCASYAAAISCTHADGGWNLVVAGDRESCARVAQLMFGEDSPPGDAEIGDALGEIANITAGMLKTKRSSKGQSIQIGLPLVQAGENCVHFVGHGVRTAAARVTGSDLQLQVVLVWRDR